MGSKPRSHHGKSGTRARAQAQVQVQAQAQEQAGWREMARNGSFCVRKEYSVLVCVGDFQTPGWYVSVLYVYASTNFSRTH